MRVFKIIIFMLIVILANIGGLTNNNGIAKCCHGIAIIFLANWLFWGN